MKRLIPFFLIAAVFALSACNLPTSATATPEGFVSTRAAQTLQAMQTQAGATATGNSSPSATPQTQPDQPSATPPPTNAPAPSAVPSSTPVPLPCDAADFVSDVNVPDGANIAGGAKFIKTWRLKNTGVCTWTTSYAVVFVDGAALNAPASFNLPGNVAPGETVDISVELTAPAANGSYRGNFKLRNPSGVVFGTGSARSASFYVDIKVAAPISTDGGYSFVDNYCAAEWSSAAGTISCTAADGSSGGFVIRTDKPALENGQIDDEPGLITVPQQTNDGVIRGKFPPLKVVSGDTFRAIVGCENKASSCEVKFQLDYQVDNGSVQTLAAWNEKSDGAFTSVSQDLSSLAGKNVRFILTVFANGSASGDRALWLKPRLERIAPTATP